MYSGSVFIGYRRSGSKPSRLAIKYRTYPIVWRFGIDNGDVTREQFRIRLCGWQRHRLVRLCLNSFHLNEIAPKLQDDFGLLCLIGIAGLNLRVTGRWLTEEIQHRDRALRMPPAFGNPCCHAYLPIPSAVSVPVPLLFPVADSNRCCPVHTFFPHTMSFPDGWTARSGSILSGRATCPVLVRPQYLTRDRIHANRGPCISVSEFVP